MGPEEVEFLTDHGLERLDIICLEVFHLVLMNKFKGPMSNFLSHRFPAQQISW